MKYFNNITTPEELKKQFRAYCVTMHPDKGGDPEEFKKMVAEYQAAVKGSTGGTSADTRGAHRQAFGLRRGSLVVCHWGGANSTRYIVLSVNGEDVELLRIFSKDFQSLDDVNFYCSEYESRESRKHCGKYDHIEPLSKKFGCGYYWDDVELKIYTEQEIKEYIHRANTFDVWVKNWEAAEAEKERIAKEEADRRESAIIADWAQYLEELPAAHESLKWDEIKDLPREERQAKEKADKKERLRKESARLGAFKRNIKAVFHRYFPGVKVTVTNSGKACRESSVISWVDGPSVAEVEAVEAFDFFRASYYEPAGPYEDYGHTCARSELSGFRQKFGAWSDDKVEYKRTLSEKTAKNVRNIIAENFPDFEADRQQAEAEHGDRCGWYYKEINLKDEKPLVSLLGFFDWFSFDWMTATEEERENCHEAEQPYFDRTSFYRKGQQGIILDYAQLYKLFVEYYKAEEQSEQRTSKKTAGQKETEQPEQPEQAEQTEETAAPADGLELVEIADGVAVVGDSRTTYKHRKEIKAHGATWNKEAQQWQATTPEAVARLRAWFGLSDEEQPKQAEPKDEERTTLHDASEITEQDKAQLSALSDLVVTLSDMFISLVAAKLQECGENQQKKAEEDKAAEAAELRKEIAEKLAQLSKLSEEVRTMSERLANIEASQKEKATTQAANDTAADGGDQGKGSRLEILQRAAEDSRQKLEAGDTTGATLAELYALAYCGVTVSDLIVTVKTIEQTRINGRLSDKEPIKLVKCKHTMRQRAAESLTDKEYFALFGKQRPGASNQAAA